MLQDFHGGVTAMPRTAVSFSTCAVWYNMKRVIKPLGSETLMKAMRA